MTSFYSEKHKFLLALDCIIFGFHEGELNLLLLHRSFEPEKGRLSLPGGFLKENESLNDAAIRVLNELTGLENLYMEQVHTFGDVNRDSGERVVSVAYYALINIKDYDTSLLGKYNAIWVKSTEVPNLVFDHSAMVKSARQALRKRAAVEPVGFNLLPEKFTLPQFQTLYEAIYGEVLDKRNFRKKVLNMNVLEKLNEKDKLSSKRGAFLYRFNEEKYKEFISKGYDFTI